MFENELYLDMKNRLLDNLQNDRTYPIYGVTSAPGWGNIGMHGVTQTWQVYEL